MPFDELNPALRAALHQEVHARPPQALQAPMAVTHWVQWKAADGRGASRAHLAALLAGHGLAAPADDAAFVQAELGELSLRWELHTEFVTWTFLRRLQAVELAALASGGLALRIARAGGDGARAARLGAALTLVTWIALNKVWSPQYALYGFLAGALAAGPGWLFGLLSAVSIADFHLEFELRARRWEPWFLETLVKPSEVVRTAAWLLLAVFVARRLAEAARPAAAVGPGPAGGPAA